MRASTTLVVPLLLAMFSMVFALLMPFDSAGTEATPTFDHFTTGFRLEGSHRLVECEGCHINGVFAGTPDECNGCHAQASRIRATWQPPRHITVTKRCESCHRSVTFVPVARVDHLEVQGTCSSCHNNITAPGQLPQHIPTVDECDACHNTRFWR